ncbi:MAG: PAS domain S-box protein [Balneolaceae bacterium]
MATNQSSKKNISTDTSGSRNQLDESQKRLLQAIGDADFKDFEFITEMAAKISGAKFSNISLIFEDTQWILTADGLSKSDLPAEQSFCVQAVNKTGKLFIVEDARQDDRFKNSPMVTGEPYIVSYTGAPLKIDQEGVFGTLCVFDNNTLNLSQPQLDSIGKLARQAIQLIELRKRTVDLEASNEALQKKEELLELTQSANDIGAWELDLETGITYWSDEVYKIHEVDFDFDHNKTNGIDFYHPDDRELVSKAIEKTVDSGEPFDVTARFITAKNNERWVRATGRLRKVSGNKQTLIGSFQDVTQFKKNEIEFEKERNRIDNILKGTNVGHWEWNVQTGETVFNERWANIVGYTLEELQPISIDTWMDLAHPDDLEESSRRLNECFEKKADFYEFEARMKHKDGHWVWVYDRGKVFSWTDDGKPLKMYGTHQDITKRKMYEEQLRISEEAFRGNFENAAIGMAMLDEKGRWLNVNAMVCKILGYSEEELMELTFQDLTHPEDLDSDLQLLDELVKGERDHYHMEKRYFHKEGRVIYAILAVSVVRNSAGDILYFISQMTDISNLKLAEMNLSSALAKNQATMNASTQVAIISTNLDGIITEFNEGAEQMLGYSAEEVVGQHTPELIHIEDEIREEGEILKEQTGECIEGFDVFVHRAKNAIPFTREWTYKRKNGSTYPVQLSVTAITRGDEITGFLCVATDISQLKKAEEEINTILCITQNQNERLHNFSNIVTHNLRSHAGGIIGMLEILKHEYPQMYSNEYIQLLEKGVDNLKDTIEHLTGLVKKDFTEQDDFKEVNLGSYVERNKNSLITQAMKKEVKIINNVAPEIEVNVIPGYLDSIVMNFMTNGIKYSEPEKESYVKVEAELSDSEEFVILSIHDNGLGIDLKNNGRNLFGMYQTFHEHEDSRGVGLYITKNQIESMGGDVEVESEPGVGTTFHIYLPKATSGQQPPPT